MEEATIPAEYAVIRIKATGMCTGMWQLMELDFLVGCNRKMKKVESA